MIGHVKMFLGALARHWLLTIVLLVVVSAFAAPFVMRLATKIPVVGPWLAARAA